MKNQTNKEHTINRILLGLIIALLAVIVISTIFYLRATRPMTQAKQEATKLAEQYANLEEVDQFYWFTREATYFSLTGQNDKGQDIAVIIPKSGERVKVLEQKAGLTEEAARQEISKQHPDQQVEKAFLGMYKDEPVWEVITKTSDDQLNYYLLSFKTGEEVKVISGV
ncbi:DUF5590 domain-containing protein [Enterococcus pernyi]|uniref:cell wall elongation regulator TseB-like domain-containing protein n=1 Tax=Enterococcus pernyi TaxID=590158 RepID=UPI000789BDF5|nr:DUF5590 domain-containing protein [Enterococcus pernyi]